MNFDISRFDLIPTLDSLECRPRCTGAPECGIKLDMDACLGLPTRQGAGLNSDEASGIDSFGNTSEGELYSTSETNFSDRQGTSSRNNACFWTCE